jgi:dipicolinate synthase subunit A
MFQGTVLCIPRSEAILHAEKYLIEAGLDVTRTPAPDVTHLLLPIPSFHKGDGYLAHILADLPEKVIVCGGNLSTPLLENFCTVDFLQDSYYLCENAAITARCAIQLLENRLSFDGCRILVLGWGRIGKCLSFLLRNQGAAVSIAARKAEDLAMIKALGFISIPMGTIRGKEAQFDAVINTVPAMILPEADFSKNCIAMELASLPGMSGDGIISARGLPARLAPKESGKLIAETFLRLAV